jgi:hypothetical protein
MQALWRAIHCLDEENAIAAMESAIHTKFLPSAVVKRIDVLAPRRLQPAAQCLVAGSGSGNETIVRRRIERAGYRVEVQAYVPGMGRGDLLLEDASVSISTVESGTAKTGTRSTMIAIYERRGWASTS